MNIVVLIKQVPSTTNARMDPKTGVMLRDASDTVLNPLDENAITEAVKIKQMHPGTIVTVLTMGPESAQKVLFEACARGADQGVLLSHRAFGGSDTIATARVLAAAIRKLGPFDLILAGEKATDGETGQTGPMTATLLDVPVLTFIRQLSIEGNKIRAQRLVEEGTEEIEIRLPAMFTVIRDINDPPLPTLRKYVMAKKLSFPIWGPADIGVKDTDVGLKGSSTRVAKVFSPKLARNTTFYHTDTEEKATVAVRAVLELLNSRDLMNKGEAYGH